MILSGGYVTANRSSSDVENSEQHEIATTVAQTQLELLNAQPNLSSIFSITPLVTACYYPSSPTNYQLVSSSNPSLYSNVCQSNYGGYPEDFAVTITEVSPGSPDALGVSIKTYQVDVKWPRLGGSGTDDVKMYYQTNGQ